MSAKEMWYVSVSMFSLGAGSLLYKGFFITDLVSHPREQTQNAAQTS